MKSDKEALIEIIKRGADDPWGHGMASDIPPLIADMILRAGFYRPRIRKLPDVGDGEGEA